ncbi:MAG TPA: NADH-ubiquinone oxidoreductase-F iron-sulfur binding region domain-containing protein [Spirochaetota bacterium]|nr:NADH-ubiquinone oxidoreductase-F iron-sulfur binding region domain-containing protein [Spirochaetota bacterium]HPJ40088.1 NADH-ubiquinone oxidoreductase-F iron-sulfur binding region domain-containing protein [Spirochaetota bacterium]HPQ52573.1 NADH-ubiquinone oxidoreductase-F iron-sulfur binding region domain-containing protein [Spirochaetota bacterium]
MTIKRIKVGAGSCGIAAGASELLTFFQQEISDIPIVEVGCIGHCYAEPIVEIETDNGSLFYENVKPHKDYLDRILSLRDEGQLVIRPQRSDREMVKILSIAGRIEMNSINEYIANGGYEGLKKALKMKPSEVIEEVIISGLRGRGGGGFMTGTKWRFLSDKNSSEKVLICNADEGDPGAFMDRSLMESVPHQILEGMLIGAYATGATKLFIYCRAEYPLAIKNLKRAMEQIFELNLHNLNGRTVEIRLKEGAGAFVCGEETAMIHSLEGKRGTPRFRPPYPTDSGFQGLPTVINNVETFGNISLILREGGAEFAKVGTEGSKGTKLFALAGDVKYPGLAEVPMGVTLADIVYEVGGAEPGTVKAVQIGGPSGGCIPAEKFDAIVDYDSLKSLGAIMGSGGLIVIGNNRCMVETSRYFLEFTTRESCGKCTFCRIGTKRMLERLEKITGGEGTEADIDFLSDIGNKIVKGSLCGLGQTAPNPVLASLRYFRNEFEAHTNERQCPALQCNKLTDVIINEELCIECGLCVKTCPVNAISEDYIVNNSVCTRCNSCIEVCPKKAISRTKRGSGHYAVKEN